MPEMAKIATDWYADLGPAIVRPFLRTLFLSVVDPRVVRACGIKPPGILGRTISRWVMKYLGRRDPVPDGSGGDPLRILSDKIYPNGYSISDLGPSFAGGCPVHVATTDTEPLEAPNNV